jgi:hypothetical protein
MLRAAITPLPGRPYRVHRAAAKICYVFRESERKVMTRIRSGSSDAFNVLYVLFACENRLQPALARHPPGPPVCPKGGARRPSACHAGGASADLPRQGCKADIASQLSQGTVQS